MKTSTKPMAAQVKSQRGLLATITVAWNTVTCDQSEEPISLF